MNYVIEGLDSRPFEPYFGLTEAQLIERNAVRMTVTHAPGFPCRITLEETAVGRDVILLNHLSRDGKSPYRASHAIFVCEGASDPARFENAIPPVFRPRVLSLRGFDAGGMMVDALLTELGEAEAGLLRLFENEAIVEIDVHNAMRGCFSARARRA